MFQDDLKYRVTDSQNYGTTVDYFRLQTQQVEASYAISQGSTFQGLSIPATYLK